MSEHDLGLLRDVSAEGLTQVQAWRRGPAGSSEGGQSALTTWTDLSNRGVALASSRAAEAVTVAFMGRVKAGKSTLLNSLVGRHVAGTHAFEMTAALHEIAVGPAVLHESARLIRSDGTADEMNPEALATLIESHRDDADFWSGVAHLKTQVRSTELPSGIVFFDTPGVGTLTSANAQVTASFLDAAHVIVWVQSGTSLGHAEDIRFLTELMRRGQRLMTVVTRADLLDEDEKEELLEWFEETFPALERPLLTCASEWQENPESRDRYRLIDKVMSAAADRTSQGASPAVLADDLVDASRYELSGLDQLSRLFGYVDASTQLMQERVVADVEQHVLAHMDELLDERRRHITGEMEQRVKSTLSPGDAVRALLGEELNESRTAAVLESIQKEAQNRLVIALGEALRKSLEGLNDELDAMEADVDRERLSVMTRELTALGAKQAEEREKSTLLFGGAAVAAAGYAAWFGANAAAVSLGAALVSVALPIVAVGAIGTWLFQRNKRAEVREKAMLEATQVLKEYRARLKSEVLEGYFFPALRTDVRHAAEEVADVLTKEISGGISRSVAEHARTFFQLVTGRRFEEAVKVRRVLVPG